MVDLYKINMGRTINAKGLHPALPKSILFKITDNSVFSANDNNLITPAMDSTNRIPEVLLWGCIVRANPIFHTSL